MKSADVPPLEHALYLAECDSPLGVLQVALDESGRLALLEFGVADIDGIRRRFGKSVAVHARAEGETEAVLARYFNGDMAAIDVFEIVFGGTKFQQKCWSALRAIPAGKTWTYGEQARFIQQPNAVRAVGRANGANPIAIVVPCHRVIGANAQLTGYAGGLERKAWLLAHEAEHSQHLLC